ncbi:PTS sugar transporter subunit IIA [Enterococcus sp. LJL120]
MVNKSKNIAEMIQEELIFSDISADNLKNLFDKIGTILYEKGYVSSEYAEKLYERENNFPTGLATKTLNVAIPHTDSKYVKKPFITILKPNSEIVFHQMGTFPSDQVLVYPKIIFILGFTKDDMQLKILQTLMNLFDNQEAMEILEQQKNNIAIYQYIKKIIQDSGGE